MRVAIFGGTGRTGRVLLEAALAAGYEVKAFARTPAKLDRGTRGLTVVGGELTDVDAIGEAVVGTSAVISVLGPTHNLPEFEVSAGMARIIGVMHELGVERLIATAGAGIPDAEDRPNLTSKFFGWMVRTFSRHVYVDMLRTAELVRASGLAWTLVRVPMLNDRPGQGHVKVAWVGRGMGRQVSRADLAAFLVAQLENSDYVGKSPAVSN